jgi:pyruvate kinase
MSWVKIVATIGPHTNNEDSLKALFQAGMNIARLNGAHSDLNWHTQTIANLRKVAPGVPVLLDLPGGKIRTGKVKNDFPVKTGDQVIFTTAKELSDSNHIYVNHPDLPEKLKVGDELSVDDGSLFFTVVGITESLIICQANSDGAIRSNKGIQIRGTSLRGDFFTEPDQELLTFARQNHIDYIGLSFVENGSQVEAIRMLIGKDGPGIVSKIETQSALDNLDGIIKASDALMIDRGDLSVETSIEQVPLLQKQILTKARLAACPVIIATQMLHSMISHNTPTKAEVSDITNAVLEGASGLMLSNETAAGKYPIEAVTQMRVVADAASKFLLDSLNDDDDSSIDNIPTAIADAIDIICRRLKITKIVIITKSGFAARMISAKIPRQQILAISNDIDSARRFNLLRGTKGVYVNIPFSRTSVDHIPTCLEALWRSGELEDEDLILVTAVGYPKSGNRMNLIQTHKVKDLQESLGWKIQ